MNRNENRCANTEATEKMYREQDKADLILEQSKNNLFKAIEPYIDGLNNSMRIHAMFSGMDKQEILEYVKETLDNLLEVK